MDSGALDLPDPSRAKPEELLAHAVWVRKLARALVSDEASADDLAQDALVAALQHPPEANRPLKPWFSRVVRNLATSKQRQSVRRSDREHLARVEHEVHAPDDVASSIEMQRMLLDAVESLREPLRSTVVRHYFHGQTSVEIAAVDGIADATVRWRLKQAIDALRTQLDEHHRGDRRAWSLLMMPLANFPKPTAAPQPWIAAASGAIGSVLAMNVLVKTVAATALVIVVAWSLWKIADSRPLTPVVTETHANVAELEGVKAEPSAPSSPADRVAITVPAAKPAVRVADATDYEAIVEARVIDARGLPIVGAMLICVDRVLYDVEREAAPKTTSGADGHVRLVLHKSDRYPNRGRPAGQAADAWELELDVESKGHALAHISADFRAGQTTNLGDVVLADGGDLSGRVVDASGRGIARATVQLRLPELKIEERDHPRTRIDAPELSIERATSSADGSFLLRGVPVGTYRLWAASSGYRVGFSEVLEVVGGIDLRVADVVLPANTRAIRGIVLNADGSRASHPQLEATPAGQDTWLGQSIEDDGSFVIEDIDAPRVDIYAKVFFGGDAIARNVEPGTRDVVLRISTRAAIDLLVTDEHDTPIETYTVAQKDQAGSGESTCQPRPAGKCAVQVFARPFVLSVAASGFEEKTIGTITAETAPATLHVRLRAMARVTGRVIVDGRGVGDAHVTLVAAPSRNLNAGADDFPFPAKSHEHNTVSTAADGTFTIDQLATGRFLVVARKPGFASAQSRELDLSPTVGASGIELVCTKGGAVAGRLITRAGDTPLGSCITVSRGLAFDSSTLVDEAGHYEIDALAPGRWWIARTSSGSKPMGRREHIVLGNPTLRAIDIVEGQTTVFDLDVTSTPPVTFVGRITIAGVSTKAWTASLVAEGQDEWRRSALGIADDGSFRFVDLDVGTAQLVLRSAAMADRDEEIAVDVNLVCGENAWSLDVACGDLDVDGPALANGALLSHVRRFENGSVMTTRFRSRDGSRLTLANVPLGDATIVDASGKVLGDVESKPGERAHVIWR